MRKDHQHQQHEQIQREEADRCARGERAEERRHQRRAGIGACHLHADDRLRALCAEVGGRGVDQAGIDRRAAEPDEDQPGERGAVPDGEQHQQDAKRDNPQSQAHHLPVAELEGQKAADGPSRRDTEEEETAALCGRDRVDAAGGDEIAAGPKTDRLFDGAIAEEAQHHGLDAAQRNDLTQRKRPSPAALRRAAVGRPPEGKTEEQNGREYQLDQPDAAVAGVPAVPGSEHRAHDDRPHRRADAPHAVQPAHMPAGIMEGDIVVQRRVDAARAKPVRDRPEAEHRIAAAEGKAEERRAGHRHADRRDPARAETPRQPVAEQARDDRADGDDHENEARGRQRRADLRMDDRPRGAEQRVRQTETDKGEINDPKQQREHKRILVFF